MRGMRRVERREKRGRREKREGRRGRVIFEGLARCRGEEGVEFGKDVGYYILWQGAAIFSASCSPVETLDLVGQDDSADGKPGRYSY
ncbi:MAG: hypothetical protein U0232_24795 [Thermomicrobiales bacterium]